jgi:hypothetical protein
MSRIEMDEMEKGGRVLSAPGSHPADQAPAGLGASRVDPSRGLPQTLLAELSCLPEEPAPDFTCAICQHVVTNRWNYSPRDYERPPICKSCESVTGYSWNGGTTHRTKPSGGSFRDRREALRIGALADAIASEATRQAWRTKHARA